MVGQRQLTPKKSWGMRHVTKTKATQQLNVKDIPHHLWVVGGQGEKMKACGPRNVIIYCWLWREATMSRLTDHNHLQANLE